jgi:hypothetical protein
MRSRGAGVWRKCVGQLLNFGVSACLPVSTVLPGRGGGVDEKDRYRRVLYLLFRSSFVYDQLIYSNLIRP